MSDDYDEIEINLRSVGEISHRLVVLLATSRRLELEYDARDAPEQDLYAVETDRFETYSWIRANHADTVTEVEQAFLRTPAGEATEEQIERHALDATCSIALGWVLGLVPNLGLDLANPTTIENLRALAPKPWDEADSFRKPIAIRDESDVWEERERLYLLRLRGLLDDVAHPTERRAAIRDVVEEAAHAGLPVRGGDLVIESATFGDLDEDAKIAILATTDAFVHALTWACGLGSSWEDVPLDDL